MVTKTVEFESLRVLADGRIQVRERTNYLERGVIQSSVLNKRIIDLGDDVSAEIELTRDVVDGLLHTQERIDERDAAEPER